MRIGVMAGFRWIVSLILCALAFIANGQPEQVSSTQTALHLLDYIGVDYAGAIENGHIKNDDEYREMREFAAQAHVVIVSLPQKEGQSQLVSDAELLARRIDEKAPPNEISDRTNALRWAIIRAYQVQVAPVRTPDLRQGATLYATHCVQCHGSEGHGDGVAAKRLDPPPANFHETPRMDQRSAYGLYSTITLGVEGTSMASFKQLTEDQRWSLAFYIATFAADQQHVTQGKAEWQSGTRSNEFATLDAVATLSATEVRDKFGDDAVALFTYLRANPAVLELSKPAPLDFASTTLVKSLDAYRRGAHSEATQLAIQAYLEGFELVESSLRNVDADLMTRTERAMMDYRGLVQANAPIDAVERQATATRALLDAARETLGGVQLSPATAFVSALIILLREGAEAILVVAAILAFVLRAGRREARRYVHAGWIVALALGAVTWLASNYLVEISGANREVTEGVTALIAAGMLLYVGYWLHSKSHSAAWQKFIGDKVGGALSQGTLWTLALIAFLAVYREAFETVLFYQALVAQAGPGGHTALMGGVFTALLLLVALTWIILRASVKLPLGLFFSTSGILLLILAVIFSGQGIAALQEAGKIGVHPVKSISIPILGIYPTAQTIAAQLIAALLSGLGLWWVTRSGKPR